MQLFRILHSTGTLLGALGFLHLGIHAQAAVSLSEAVDAPALVWSTVGSPAWEGQSIVSIDGLHAAASGLVSDGTAVTLQTTVTGPGIVSFWWKVSSELTNDYLKFFISGYQQTRISGEVNWQQQTFNIPAGSQVLKWTYSKNASGSAGLDRGWVDQVHFEIASNCTFTVSPVNSMYGPGPATGSVVVATMAGCPWSVVNSNTWIHIPTGEIRLGNGTVEYTLDPNETSTPRLANLSIAGQTIVMAQGAVPSSDPNNPVSLPEALDTTGVNLVWTTTGAAPWTGQSAVNHDGFDAAQSGALPDSTNSSMQTVITGPGILSFWWKVSSEVNSDRLRLYVNGVESANISGEVNWTQRSVALASGSQTVQWKYTKNSAGAAGLDRGWVDQVQFSSNAPCTFTLSAAGASHIATSSTGLVSIAAAAGCAWNVVNTNAWVAIASGANGSGDGLVRYVLTANPDVNRTGTITIADQTFTISQLGFVSGCAYAISPTTRTHGYGATTNSVSITAPADCTWTVLNSNSWLSFFVTAGPGNATISYSIDANPATQSRTGFVTLGGHPFTITQLGVTCTYALSPASRDHGAGAVSGAINVNTALACSWNASTTNSWITILPGTNNFGAGIVNYAVAANTNAPRTGSILAGGQSFSIHQAGVTSSLTLVRQPNGDVTLTFSGILQSAATVSGTFQDVPGNPQGTYTIQKGSLEQNRFFRTRTP